MQFPLSHSISPPIMYITFFVRLESIPLHDGTVNYLNSLLMNILIDSPDFLIFQTMILWTSSDISLQTRSISMWQILKNKTAESKEVLYFSLDIAQFSFIEIVSIYTFVTNMSRIFVNKVYYQIFIITNVMGDKW